MYTCMAIDVIGLLIIWCKLTYTCSLLCGHIIRLSDRKSSFHGTHYSLSSSSVVSAVREGHNSLQPVNLVVIHRLDCRRCMENYKWSKRGTDTSRSSTEWGSSSMVSPYRYSLCNQRPTRYSSTYYCAFKVHLAYSSTYYYFGTYYLLYPNTFQLNKLISYS